MLSTNARQVLSQSHVGGRKRTIDVSHRSLSCRPVWGEFDVLEEDGECVRLATPSLGGTYSSFGQPRIPHSGGQPRYDRRQEFAGCR